MNKCTWLTHECHVNEHSANWSGVPGLYIFAGVNSAGQWYPLYIGQAESLAERIPNHERWLEAQKLGATHVHAMVVRDKTKRCAIEAELVQTFQPRLNTLLK